MEWLVIAVSVLSAAFAFWQASEARAARRDARAARDESEAAAGEATRLAAEANDAFRAQTAALERRNELAEAALPKPHVAWEIRTLRGSMLEIVNVGNIPALSARVFGIEEAPGFIIPDDDEPRDVSPGDGLAFGAMRVMGPKPHLRIEWNHEDGTPDGIDRILN